MAWVITYGEEQVYSVVGPFTSKEAAEEFRRQSDAIGDVVELEDPAVHMAALKEWR